MEIGDTVGARLVPNSGRVDFLERFLNKEAR